jgi:CcmD family protein
MEQNLGFLFAAFFVAWLVLLLYVVSLAGRVSSLRRELDRLKREQDSGSGDL